MADDRKTILVVDGDAGMRARLEQALDGYRTMAVAGRADALAKLGEGPVDLVLTEYRLPDGDGIALLRECAARFASTRRLLVAAYDDVPSLVKAHAGGLAARVIQRSTRGDNVRRIVDETLGAGTLSARVEAGAAFGWAEMEQLLRWTAGRVVQMNGVVIRQLTPDVRDLQMQFVLPVGEEFEALRAELLARWRWPLKAKDAPLAVKDRRHPVAELLGELEDPHEVYARRVDGEQDEVYVYLALLAWRREPRVTAALGICRDGYREILGQLLLDVHRRAVEEVAELQLPAPPLPRPERTGPGQTVLEYDWVVTDSYVGPDRRARPTSFLNRFVLVGKRKRVPSRLRKTTGAFIDRLSRRARVYGAWYLALSLVDTVLTWVNVRGGAVRELNPLLRPLLEHHPWGFLVGKTALSLVSFGLVARFQLFRAGKLMLAASVTTYALVDLYWLYLLRSGIG